MKKDICGLCTAYKVGCFVNNKIAGNDYCVLSRYITTIFKIDIIKVDFY